MQHIAVPTTLDAVLDPEWLTEALVDIDDGDRIVRVEEVDSSKTLAQKVRFRIMVERADGVQETRAYCEERGLPYREDSSNPETKRGLIRNEILPLLERLDPRARASLLALADDRARLPRTLERTLTELLAGRDGTKAADLGGGVRAVREYGTVRLEGRVTWGPWTLESDRDGLEVRSRRPGDRLAGRSKKVQDLLVDAKVPRVERDSWPLVVCGDEVVAVPGLAEAPGWEGAVTWRR